MRCHACGTEIADKALVCFRCGAATSEPIHSPAPARGKSSAVGTLASLLALVLLVVLALFMGRFATGNAPRALLWVLVGVVAVVVVLRVVSKRR